MPYLVLHGQTPQYIADLLLPHITSRALRSSELKLLDIPRTRFKTCTQVVECPPLIVTISRLS